MINVRPTGKDISALDSARRTFSLFYLVYLSPPPAVSGTSITPRTVISTLRADEEWGALVLLVGGSAPRTKAHLAPVVIQAHGFPSAQTSTWQRFGNVLALTRPGCLRLSCELSAGSTGSSWLFLALSECWLSALLFCLLSLHFYHVGKCFALGPVHSQPVEQPSAPEGLWRAAQLLLENAALR